jgi:hypothetical protein
VDRKVIPESLTGASGDSGSFGRKSGYPPQTEQQHLEQRIAVLAKTLTPLSSSQDCPQDIGAMASILAGLRANSKNLDSSVEEILYEEVRWLLRLIFDLGR